MGAFKTLTNRMIGYFNARSDVNEVTFGDGSMVDTSSRTEFPLIHIIPISSNYTDNIGTHTYQILSLTTKHVGDEVIDVLDLTNQILAEFVVHATNSTLFGQVSSVQATPVAETLYSKFKNVLYGYNLNIQITIPTDLPPC